MKRLFPYLPYVALTILSVSVAIILYWLFSVPNQAVTVKKTPVPVLSKSATPGGFIPISSAYCKNISARGRAVTSLVGTTSQISLPVAYESRPKGCVNMIVNLPVPTQATPGTYHYHFRITYQVNPLRSIIQDYDSESFNIKE